MDWGIAPLTNSTWTLAIDVGTSRTAAAAAGADGAVTPIELEGNRWMSSAVAVDDDGQLVVGRAAIAIGSSRPDRAERSPKRSVGAPAPMVLGERSIEPAEAFAALMTAVADEARRRHDGQPPSRLALTHPVRWEALRQQVLIDAAELAGLPEPLLVAEPVAAATHYAAGELADGATIGVYDLGGGTFDTVVMRKAGDGFEVLGPPGGDESIGGDHFDHLIFLHLGQMLSADDAEVWQQLQFSSERKWMRAAHDLLIEARQVKETLSMYPSTQIYVPVADRELLLTREELETLIARPIERSVDELLDTIEDAGLETDEVDAVYLVGGSSRIPLVTERLEAEFGLRVRTRDEPKSVVVEGAAMLGHLSVAAAFAFDDSREPIVVSGPSQLAGDAELLVVSTPDSLVLSGSDGVRTIGHDGTLSSPAALRDRVAVRVGAHGIGVWSPDGSAEASGGPLWTVDLGGVPAAGPAAAGDSVVAAVGGSLTAIDRRGAVVWSVDTEHQITALTGSVSVVLASTIEGRVVCVDAMSGTIRWLYPTRAALHHPVALAGSLLHAASSDGILYSLEVDTGRPRWAYQCTHPATAAEALAPVTVGRSVVVPAGAELIGLDRVSGEELWRASLDGAAPNSLRGGRAFGVLGASSGVHLVDEAGALTAVPGAHDALEVGTHVAIAAADRVVWWAPDPAATRNDASE